eukprot:CAMPEP_0173367006 /NCGR_PEP_ID=MMETSP1144-20121109/24603_1 /TAXON_ID=483371 /ORGANISM="non described non described, Strain CCMP2298" /LENGTH=45 /DNA_ID= /DNA_START= /DNA_END= /DNA_ORIENTATION=
MSGGPIITCRLGAQSCTSQIQKGAGILQRILRSELLTEDFDPPGT